LIFSINKFLKGQDKEGIMKIREEISTSIVFANI